KKVRSAHRRRRKPLENLSGPRVYNRKADAPQTAPHEIHSDKTGHEKIYISASGLGHLAIFDRDYIGAAKRSLKGVAHRHSRAAAVGSRRIVSILKTRNGRARDGPVAPCGVRLRSRPRARRDVAADHQRDLSRAKRSRRLVMRHRRSLNVRRLREASRKICRSPGVTGRSYLDRDTSSFRSGVSKRDAERASQKHREHKHPEHKLRLAKRFLQPAKRQLPQRAEPFAPASIESKTFSVRRGF